MNTLVIQVPSWPHQSGKTTLAIAMFEGLSKMDLRPMLVVPDQQSAWHIKDQYGIFASAWTDKKSVLSRACRNVILDDYSRFDRSEGDPISIFQQRAMNFHGPCQIITFG